MKSLIITLFTVLFTLNSYADQLSYITKKQADESALLIRKLDYLYLFCGCCIKEFDNTEVPVLVKIVKVEVEFTNYEKFYQVILTYQNENGDLIRKGIDLAYVWTKYQGEVQTIGEIMQYKHDVCNRLTDLYKL